MNNPKTELMSGHDFRESLRRYKPTVFVDGQHIASVADERSLQPGINAIALTYDFAHKPEYAPVMTAVQQTSGKTVNRLTHISTSSAWSTSSSVSIARAMLRAVTAPRTRSR